MASSSAVIFKLSAMNSYKCDTETLTVVVAVTGETPVRRMLGVLQAIISGQQPDMRAVHKLHELIVSGDITGDVSLCWV